MTSTKTKPDYPSSREIMQPLSLTKSRLLIVASNLTGIIFIFISLLNIMLPDVGHDYFQFIPRLLDTHLFYKLNGIKIQWYSPTFGGGLPAFPNPQNIQFSLPQFFTLFIQPWWAVNASLAIFLGIGFLTSLYFFNKIAKFEFFASMLGSMFLIGNGFFLQHTIVGHVTFFTYPLISIILICLFDKNIPRYVSSTVLAVAWSIILHQGGSYIFIILFFSLALSLPVLHMIRPDLFDFRRIFLVSLLGSALTLLISASKLSAIFSLMQFFPREIADSFNTPFFFRVWGIIIQILGLQNLFPLLMLKSKTPDLLYRQWFLDFLGTPHGVHELDISISPALTIILIAGLVLQIYKLAREKPLRFSFSQFILLAVIWITFQFITAKGLIYDSLADFPILRSLHVNVRYTSSFILPLTITGAHLLDMWSNNISRTRFITFIIFSNAVFFLSFFPYYISPFKELSVRNFKIYRSKLIYQNIEANKIFRVDNIMDVPDEVTLLRHASNTNSFNVIFGYSNESFFPEFVPGPVRTVTDGYYNITNPASLVFPKVNGLHLFERINVNDRENFEKFINYHEPKWELPLYQKIFNKISLWSLLFSLLALLAYLFSVIIRMPGQTGHK